MVIQKLKMSPEHRTVTPPSEKKNNETESIQLCGFVGVKSTMIDLLFCSKD